MPGDEAIRITRRPDTGKLGNDAVSAQVPNYNSTRAGTQNVDVDSVKRPNDLKGYFWSGLGQWTPRTYAARKKRYADAETRAFWLIINLLDFLGGTGEAFNMRPFRGTPEPEIPLDYDGVDRTDEESVESNERFPQDRPRLTATILHRPDEDHENDV
ncbi:unnamed protein product [Gongylonema pulchrum]|uniref:DUF5681 domain-containing protein n=1 Tax=Gongylonema pulchrum TaxID=637853 RepID=A0A183CXC7_9BILA|nr:unnamed protein product [Gongylonema pulchrum]